ncbi:MAG: 3-kinase [Marmoricola sp.]|nr:3-kinase [Marmoricola sp.]
MIERDNLSKEKIETYLDNWSLTVDGEPTITSSSYLLPVKQNSIQLMLKIALVAEEKRGNLLMVWWRGEGAACVFKHDNEGLLLERASGSRVLTSLSQQGQDDLASHIICQVAAKLHAHKDRTPPNLVPLNDWFTDLCTRADNYGGILSEAAVVANGLLANPQDRTILHGDLHHQNILDFDDRGWLAIDPKGLVGERGFDFANILCNPTHSVATSPDRFAHQLTVIADQAQLDRKRLQAWVLAWAGLSAIWSLQNGDDSSTALAVAALAANERL